MAFSYPASLDALRSFYGLLPRPPSDLFQFFVWEILSRDTIPGRRDLAWQALRRLHALTPDAVWGADPRTLLDALAPLGGVREERLTELRATAVELRQPHALFASDRLRRGGLLHAARALGRLSRVDEHLRQRALLFALEFPVFPFDAASSRVMARLVGSPHATVEARRTRGAESMAAHAARQRRHARGVLVRALPREVPVYQVTITYLAHHASHTCVTVPHCTVCPLNEACPSRRSGARAPGAAAVDGPNGEDGGER